MKLYVDEFGSRIGKGEGGIWAHTSYSSLDHGLHHRNNTIIIIVILLAVIIALSTKYYVVSKASKRVKFVLLGPYISMQTVLYI